MSTSILILEFAIFRIITVYILNGQKIYAQIRIISENIMYNDGIINICTVTCHSNMFSQYTK